MVDDCATLLKQPVMWRGLDAQHVWRQRVEPAAQAWRGGRWVHAALMFRATECGKGVMAVGEE